MNFDTSLSLARALDAQDPLAGFKQQFHFPQHNGSEVIYFCGNSLGLQPKGVEAALAVELQSWRNNAVEGYFKGTFPWLRYQDYLIPSLARIVGAGEHEVTAMNALTVNLHLLMQSFYRPRGRKHKILMEAGAFPSDQYAVQSQLEQHGYEYDAGVIELRPREGERTLRTEDILQAIADHAEELALVLLGGINYYTGQLFDIPAITRATQAAEAVSGWDLAHVTGNVPLQLHGWNVDFAVWCSYKYLNGGPGAVGGAFVHERYVQDTSTPRLAGWWGNDEKERFKMERGFVPKSTASGWNLSTAQVFNMVSLRASLELFDAAGMDRLRSKSLQLTNYLEFLLQQLDNVPFEVITPAVPEERGAQLSLYFKENGKAIHQKLMENGIMLDYREPGVVRVAPAPLYCSFEDVFRFYEIIRENF
jgi:kynureninase